jgi:hypothetical protein
VRRTEALGIGAVLMELQPARETAAARTAKQATRARGMPSLLPKSPSERKRIYVKSSKY